MTSPEERLVRVTIDDNVCLGSGLCEMNATETFAVDDDSGIAVVVGSGLLPIERAETVVDSCPAQAISIVDDEQDR